MPKHHPPFTYIPPTPPIACEHCGGKARFIERSPLAAGVEGEMLTFQCRECGNQTKRIANEGA